MKISSLIKTFAFAFVAATAIIGFTKTTQAATTTETKTYKNYTLSEYLAFIDHEKSEGSLLSYGDNSYVIKKSSGTYKYSITQKTIELDKGVKCDITDNYFDSEAEANEFIENTGMEDGKAVYVGYWDANLYALIEYYYVEGSFKLYDITVAPYETEVTAINFTGNPKKYGSCIEIPFEVVGGSSTDIEWYCNDPSVQLSVSENTLTAYCDEEVGTVKILATASNGVCAYTWVKF